MAKDRNIRYDYLFKYIIIGDTNVGKSNLLIKFTHGMFKEEYQATIGVEFGIKNIDIGNKLYRIQIWDTAGQENFKSITKGYYKNSACAIIVYDITNRESFYNLNNWIEDCKNLCPKDVIMALVGNKSDLEDKRLVTTEEGKEFADNHGIAFYETSAKNGNNVEDVFVKSAEEIAKKIKEGKYNLDDEECGIRVGNNTKDNNINNNKNKITNLEGTNNKKKKKCC